MTLRRTARRPGFLLKLAETGLWLLAAACAGCWATAEVQVKSAQRAAGEVEIQATGPVPATEPSALRGASTLPAGTLLGRLEIAPVGLSVPVLENYDAATLVRGVGHVPGTALPGGLGNLVLAGHRDTFFRPLRHIEAGMEIRMISPTGRWRYIVDRTEVVTPDQVGVLDIGNIPGMTLITCYPFEFIGSAPKRFIVHAHLVSAEAG